MSNNIPYTYPSQEPIKSDFQVTLHHYLKNWRWFVFSLVVALIAGYVYLLYATPLYKIQSSLLVKDENKGISEENVLKELDFFTPKRVIENEVEILRSYTLMEKVAEQLGLDVRYYQKTPFGNREIYNRAPIKMDVQEALPPLYEEKIQVDFVNTGKVRIDNTTYPLNEAVNTPYGRLTFIATKPFSDTTQPVIIQADPLAETVQDYLKKLNVEPSSKASTVLLLSLEDAVPQKGVDILNHLIDAYNAAAVEDKNRIVANTLQFIETRLKLVSGELSSVEKDIESYKSTQGITDMSAEAQVLLSKVEQNDAQLSQTNIQLGALADIERYVLSSGAAKGNIPVTLGLSDPVLVGLIGKLTELELQRDAMARTTSEANPLLRALEDQITATKTNVYETIQNHKKILNGTRQQLLATNGRFESLIRSVPKKERALMDITRQQSIKNHLYTYLLQKREETALSYAATVADSRTIDKARSGSRPVKPIKPLIMLLFASVGLLIPVIGITLRDLLNKRVASRTDIDEMTNAPVIGEIAHVRHKNPIVVSGNDRSAVSEQIRALRTNLQFLRSGSNNLALLVTSSISGEGKSFVTVNLGASLALIKRPTVILEMDLRRPTLHSKFGLPMQTGLSNYLVGQAELDDILVPIPGYNNYWLIPCGPIPPNPTELLTSPRLEELFVKLRELFDFVLVDAPPVGLVTDAQIIGEHTDATLYMVRYNVTPKQSLRSIETLYKEQRLRKLSLVLNSVESESMYGYGYYEPHPDEGNKMIQRLRTFLVPSRKRLN
ncbi:polysaccharide biosynthesis tyrosine autokinase [Nibrella saemangeumensis]|uniref:Polysaccharide biosynthesis tyrosine autokinase n=1 Tax=Nibrella saemangeumensis TaxID=1084526 RepID=A0ABP8MY27_9BACT